MAESILCKAAKRIKEELKVFDRNKDALDLGISMRPVEDNLLDLKGEIKGPEKTPYKGGTFLLDIKVPNSYPFRPPKVRFVTKIWHPNISSVTGTICLNILDKDWSAGLTLRTILQSIQALLSAAEPYDPLDAVVARQFQRNAYMFKLTAEKWTRFYAGAPGENTEFEFKIKFLTDKGVDEEKALIALSSTSWVLN